jgi:hypothetical protein
MLQQLKSQHREIARLHFEGMRPAEIAAEVGMSISSVGAIIRDPLCQAHLERLADKADGNVIDVRKRLAEMNAKALDTLDNLLSDADVSDSVQLKAAQDVLNRNGYAPQVNHTVTHTHFTLDDLREMQQRAIDAGASVPDAEYEEN